MEQSTTEHWYNKHYKHLLVLPGLLLLFSLVYLGMFYSAHGDLFLKDVSLSGGTVITVFDTDFTPTQVAEALASTFPDAHIRAISDIRTGAQKAFYVESSASAEELRPVLEALIGYSLTSINSSTEFSGAVLSQQFYRQLLQALAVAFLLMALVVFVIFSQDKTLKAWAIMLTLGSTAALLPGIRSVSTLCVLGIACAGIYGMFFGKGKRWIVFALMLFSFVLPSLVGNQFWIIGVVTGVLFGGYAYYSVPSAAVVFAAFADIVMTLVVVNLMGMHMSVGGIIALLMLIGYSVDTDILLTTRVLKERVGTVNERMWGACKTGVTMTMTAIVAVGISLVFVHSFSDTLSQIFTIMLIGLGFDLLNKWITNASILKWFVERQA